MNSWMGQLYFSHIYSRQHRSKYSKFNTANRLQSAEVVINSYFVSSKQTTSTLSTDFLFCTFTQMKYIYVAASTYFMHTKTLVWKPSLLVILMKTRLNLCYSSLQIWLKIACTSKFMTVTNTFKNKGRAECLLGQVSGCLHISKLQKDTIFKNIKYIWWNQCFGQTCPVLWNPT